MVSLNTLTPMTTTVGYVLPASPNLYIVRSSQQFYVNGVKVSNNSGVDSIRKPSLIGVFRRRYRK